MSLSYQFFEENSGGKTVFTPKAKIMLSYYGRRTRSIYALIDSGSEVTLIPEKVANHLNLLREKEISIEGICGEKKAFLSKVRILFLSWLGVETILDIPVVIGEWQDIILGREIIFDAFKITFTQAKRRIELERMPKA